MVMMMNTEHLLQVPGKRGQKRRTQLSEQPNLLPRKERMLQPLLHPRGPYVHGHQTVLLLRNAENYDDEG
jgi:hypothetical protein